jgi:hypothetical protein
MELKMFVGNRNRRDAKHELIRQRPNQAILQNQPIKGTYFPKNYKQDLLL